jgi:tetraacyldisaccharide 4'-kinase
VTHLVDDVWRARTALGRTLQVLLGPAALAYGAGVAVRNALYDGGLLTSHRVPARVVSVGNLVVGGTGKTPTALWLARALAARGRRVGIVARGYKKSRPGVVVVGERGTPLVSPEEGGDEAVLLAGRFEGPVVTGERRTEAAGLACARFALDTIVLDDGFQHRALARDADLVLLPPDAGVPRLLPAGPAREPLRALARARAALVVRDAQGDGQGPTPALPPGLRCFRGRLVPIGLVGARGEQEPLAVLAERRVRPVAGIARPERLVSLLERLGARPASPLEWPDHHRYAAADVARIAEAARDDLVVTTEKDLVKLRAWPALETIRALRVELEVDDGDALVDLLVPEVASPLDRGYRSAP